MKEQLPQQQTPVEPNAPIGEPTAPLGEEYDSTIAESLDMQMSALPSNRKAAILDMMSPEMVQVMGAIFGPEVEDYFTPFVNPDIFLVPVPREQAAQSPTPQQPADDLASMNQAAASNIPPSGM